MSLEPGYDSLSGVFLLLLCRSSFLFNWKIFRHWTATMRLYFWWIEQRREDCECWRFVKFVANWILFSAAAASDCSFVSCFRKLTTQQQFCYSRISGSDYHGQTLVILVHTLLCVSWSPRSSVRTHNRTEVKLRLCFYTIYKKLFLQVFFLPASRSQVVKFYIQQVSSCCCWLQKLSERWKRNYFLFTILSNTPQETKIHIFKTDLIFF